MKNSKAILLAICASVFAVLTVVNMSLASPKSAGENTLDMLDIMTRAFDESEGGEGCKLGSDGACSTLPPSSPYWASCRVMSISPIYEDIVEVEGGMTFFVTRVPIGMNVICTVGQGLVGQCRDCTYSFWNECCQLDIECCYDYGDAA